MIVIGWDYKFLILLALTFVVEIKMKSLKY